MTETQKQNDSTIEVVEQVPSVPIVSNTEPSVNDILKTLGKQVKPKVKPEVETRGGVQRERRKRGNFPTYTKKQSCIQLGKKHKYVDRGTYDKCKVCGSSRTHRKTEA